MKTALRLENWKTEVLKPCLEISIMKLRFAVQFTFVFAVIALLSHSVFAQVPDPVTAAQAAMPGSAHHYIGIGGETVNPADGSLSFHVPLNPANGRGLSMPFGINYASPETFFVSNGGINGQGNPSAEHMWGVTAQWMSSPYEKGGWGYQLPSITAVTKIYNSFSTNGDNSPYQVPNNNCVSAVTVLLLTTSDYVFRGFDGIQRGLSLGDTYHYPEPVCPPSTFSVSNISVNTNENIHGIVATSPWPSTWTGAFNYGGDPPVTVRDQAGTVYYFPSGAGGNSTYAWGYLASSVIDRNGNWIRLAGNGQKYEDTLGRTAVSWTGLGNDRDELTVAGIPGNIVLHWRDVSANFTLSGYCTREDINQNPNFDRTCSFKPTSVTQKEVSGIDLP